MLEFSAPQEGRIALLPEFQKFGIVAQAFAVVDADILFQRGGILFFRTESGEFLRFLVEEIFADGKRVGGEVAAYGVDQQTA